MIFNIERILSDASYHAAWDAIKKFGAFYFVRKNADGHSFFRRDKKTLPEQKINEMYVNRLKWEIQQWHKK